MLALSAKLLLLLSAVLGHVQAQTYSTEVATVVQYFSSLADEGAPKVLALKEATDTGDLDAAKDAYKRSRSEYEQIEVLAGGFSDVDCWIDCRAYAYTAQSEGQSDAQGTGISEDEFQGFHRIEALLFRDGNTTAAAKYAAGLVDSWSQLQAALADPSNFDFCTVWDGAIALSFEVTHKKISSEEETYSDLSVLIFHNNLLGIKNVYKPFEGAVEEANATLANQTSAAFVAAFAAVTPLLEDGQTSADGAVTPYSQVSIEERDAIHDAFYALAQSLTEVKASLGTCEEEEEEEEEGGEGSVEGEGSCDGTQKSAYPGIEEMTVGAGYFKKLLAYNAKQVQEMSAAIDKGVSLEQIKAQYALVRPIYEQVEVLAPAFPDEDAAIDSRPYGFDTGELDEEFSGFHRLERLIYRDGLFAATDKDQFGIASMSEWAQGLVEQYDSLLAIYDTIPAELDPIAVFDGVLGVVTEVVAKKISSEEETWPDKSLMIFYNNWLGAYSQIKPFAITANMEPQLTTAVTACLDCFEDLITKNVPESCKLMTTPEEATDDCIDALVNMEFAPYSEVPMSKRDCIIARGHAYRQVIIDVANEVGVAGECQWYQSGKVYPYIHGNSLWAAETTGNTTSPTSSDNIQDDSPTVSGSATLRSLGLGAIAIVAAILLAA